MNGPTERVFVGLGSNVGDRRAAIASALEAFEAAPGIDLIAVSPIFETVAVGPVRQPDFLNAVACLRVTMTPRELLDWLLDRERTLGRDRRGEVRGGPRRLDLDLLLYDDRTIAEPGLTVPHPRLHERLFVLDPLLAIAPDASHPALGPLAAVREALRSRSSAAGRSSR